MSTLRREMLTTHTTHTNSHVHTAFGSPPLSVSVLSLCCKVDQIRVWLHVCPLHTVALSAWPTAHSLLWICAEEITRHDKVQWNKISVVTRIWSSVKYFYWNEWKVTKIFVAEVSYLALEMVDIFTCFLKRNLQCNIFRIRCSFLFF